MYVYIFVRRLRSVIPQSRRYAQRRAAPLFGPHCAQQFRQIKNHVHNTRGDFCVEAHCRMYMLVACVVYFRKVGDTLSAVPRRGLRHAAANEPREPKLRFVPHWAISALKPLLVCICRWLALCNFAKWEIRRYAQRRAAPLFELRCAPQFE